MQEKQEEAAARQQEMRVDAHRLALLHNEVDLLIEDGFRRQESVSNKASFLAVAAGVVLTGLTAQVWEAPLVFSLGSIAFTVLALALSAAALIPAKRAVLDARRLVDRYLDSRASRVAIEKSILQTKTDAWSSRNRTVEKHALLVTLGFWSLVCAAVTFGIGFSIHYIY